MAKENKTEETEVQVEEKTSQVSEGTKKALEFTSQVRELDENQRLDAEVDGNEVVVVKKSTFDKISGNIRK